MTATPTFLLVGAARAGTTAVIEALRAQPSVFVTQPKEPHYFALHGTDVQFQAPGDDATINRAAIVDERGYRMLYPPDAGSHVALGEGSVSTLYYHERAIPEIRRLCPDAKIVVILRDPVERAHSAYQYLVSKGFEPASTLVEALTLEDERVDKDFQHLWHYRRMGMYGEQLAPFLNAFGPEQVGVWFYDHLQSRYRETISGILQFVGVPGADVEALPPVNVSGMPRSRHVTALVSAAARQPVLRAAALTMTTFRFREKVRGVLVRKADIEPEAVALLRPAFEGDLRTLRGLLRGRDDLPAWLEHA